MKRWLVFVVCLSGLSARAQSITPSTHNSTGGTALLGTHIIDWSVGDMALVSTFSAASIIVTQGVLQPADKLPPLRINPELATINDIKVYPNPTSNLLMIEGSIAHSGTLEYQLIDIAGNVLMSNKEANSSGVFAQRLNVSQLAAATYYLQLIFTQSDHTTTSTTFTIQKLN
jgi:Secretion system C-terminal sorting domain